MTVIFNFLNGFLSNINLLTGDWGISIIVLTAIVKIAMVPLSINQKKSSAQQKAMAEKMDELKKKYEGEKENLQDEMAKLSMEGAGSLLGIFASLVQIPVMYTLYRVFSSMPAEIGSAIVPWVASIRLNDPYYIVPILSAGVQLLPGIAASIGLLKNSGRPKMSPAAMIVPAAVSILFLAKAPVTIGIYWITSGFLGFLEQLIFSLVEKKSENTAGGLAN
ncbi:membrane protein insertase, YidC/Oxa1 family, C-terminal domain-containing protein [Peptoclostridium litorale DSM 5388]|uniref:Membrane protein insertase n=1 Tax=Peptoclostridium litorale DSM 5388 TaxID=1121324 RepID=A0A069REJ4_PEPLI|nr:membrane protein insertase YidC [Peptoclostridium litorale]KDR95484.1 membrane protein insertase [Peptoclostridium litorale DSM 5388]SIO17703.1 membrane protein insertase, YidC/Oxa1 family, C-terminal domain-containing protein [Peptoclostridium litorale DSM 5388]